MQTYPVNIKANLQTLKSNSRFRDVGEGETVIFRFAPSVDPKNGLIFYRTMNHYRFKDQDGRGLALADLREHGNTETGYDDYITKLSNVLKEHGDETEKKIGKDIEGSNRYYAQGFEAVRMSDGTFKYESNRLLSVPKTAAEAVLKVMERQAMLGELPFTDVNEGQTILISRDGKGRNTKYSAERSGQKVPLDEIVPDWKTQLHKDVIEALILKVYTPAMQKQIAQLSYPKLDWERLEQEFGL